MKSLGFFFLQDTLMKVYYGSIHSAFNLMLILCRRENVSKMFGQPNRRQKNMLIKFPMKIESQEDPKVLKVTTLATIKNLPHTGTQH